MTTDLFEESTRLTENGRLTIPFCYVKTQDGQIKKIPPKGSGEWSNQRGTVYNEEYRRKWFDQTPDVVAIAIAMNSIKISIAIDIDGYEARKIFHRWLLPKFLPSLQDKIRRTAHTLSLNGGDHFVLGIKREYFPLLNLKFGNATEIATTKIWRSNSGEHSEIALIGTKSCLIERGQGYQNIRGYEYEEVLEREELVDMLAGCEAFQTEWKVIGECIKILSPYWKQPDRDEIVYAISGWWHKDSNISQEFAEQFSDFLIMASPHQDENLVKTLSVIKRSYAMNKSDVIGRSKLDEIFGGKSVRSKLKRELEKLGYTFKDAESAEHRTDAKENSKADENTTFVEDLIEEFHIKTLEDTSEFYRYDKELGIYVGNAEPFIKSTIAHRFRNLEIMIPVKMMNQFINEIQWFSYFDRKNFNKDIEWLACANCMINLKTLETAEFSPDFLCTNRIPVKYNPYPYEDGLINDFYRLIEGVKYDGILRHAPRIKKFLNDLFFPEDIEKLLNYLAYCLWRDYEFNFWLLLNGGGMNGKSLFFNIIATLFGSENVSGETLQRLSDLNNRFAVAGLFGKLANFDADISQETVFKNTGTIKKLTVNDLISGENKFKNPFKFKNNAKLFFSVNKIPETYDDSDAFYRRIILINLKQQYLGDKVDIHLYKKLTTEEELSGLLHELIQRLPKILEKGLMKVTSEAIRETQEIVDSNLIDYFYQKVIRHRPGDKTRLVSKLAMHEEYCKFAAFHKLTPESEAALSRKLSNKKYGLNYDKHTVRGERIYAWEEVSIRPDWMKIDDPTHEGTMEVKMTEFDDSVKQ